MTYQVRQIEDSLAVLQSRVKCPSYAFPSGDLKVYSDLELHSTTDASALQILCWCRTKGRRRGVAVRWLWGRSTKCHRIRLAFMDGGKLLVRTRAGHLVFGRLDAIAHEFSRVAGQHLNAYVGLSWRPCLLEFGTRLILHLLQRSSLRPPRYRGPSFRQGESRIFATSPHKPGSGPDDFVRAEPRIGASSSSCSTWTRSFAPIQPASRSAARSPWSAAW